jgi:GH24 family phage-related lysozyme (muramidase)
MSRCSATVLKDGAEGQYEKEGYGQRPYLNWKQVMFDCQGQVCKHISYTCHFLGGLSPSASINIFKFLQVAQVDDVNDRQLYGCASRTSIQ